MNSRSPEAPAVSVVIPVYNREATIRAAIESVLQQTWTDLELIVVDDGSTDNTCAEVARIGDPRLRLIESPQNAGASAARNTGIREARGDWIAFQDSDDEWLPAKLEKQMARLLAPGADYVAAYCGMLVVGRPDGSGDGRTGRPVTVYVPDPGLETVEGNILPVLINKSIVSTQTLVARRDRMLEIGGFDESFRALIDRECMLRLAQTGPVACVDEPLVIQRFSPNSITREFRLRTESKRRMIEKHLDLLSQHPDLLAELYYETAGAQRSLGNLTEACAMMAKVRRLRPVSARAWAMTIYLTLLRFAPGSATKG